MALLQAKMPASGPLDKKLCQRHTYRLSRLHKAIFHLVRNISFIDFAHVHLLQDLAWWLSRETQFLGQALELGME